MILLFLVFLSSVNSDAYNILCLLPYQGKSHYMVFEPLLDELVHRGHNLTVVSFFPKKQPLPNRRDVSLVGLAPLNVEVVNLSNSGGSIFNLDRYYDPITMNIVEESLKLCEKLINEKVFDEFINAEGDYDVILVEHFNSNCMFGVVHNYGLPSVGLMSSVMVPASLSRVAAVENPAYFPLMLLPLTEEMTFWERVENTVVTTVFRIFAEFGIWQKEQDILEKRMGRKLPWLEDVARNTSVMLVNSYHALNGVRVLPPAIVEVGGLHLHNRTVHPLPLELEKWVTEAKEGIILFSFGSLIRGSTLPKKTLRAILNVFSRLPQRVLWKWESDKIDDLPPNVRIMKWMPQYDLLNHPKCVAFITHGGLLSLTEAVSAGVPMVTMPVLGDQAGNAAHAERAGIARVLLVRELDEGRLQKALTEVLSAEMRARAKLVSAMWRSRPVSPMDLAVHHVEWTAQFGGPHLSSHARWLSFYQLALLDVVALFAAIVVSLVALVILLMLPRVQPRQWKSLRIAHGTMAAQHLKCPGFNNCLLEKTQHGW